jgi:hypothetical protein
MVIAHTITLPAANTGYSVLSRLKALSNFNFNTERVSEIKIQAHTGTAVIYVVPAEGAYANAVAGVPDSYGARINPSATTPETFSAGMQAPGNHVSLSDLILGSNEAAATVHIWAYIY